MDNHKCEHGVAPTTNSTVNTRDEATVTSPATNPQAASPVTSPVDKTHAVNLVVAPTTASAVYPRTETPVTTSIDKTHASDTVVAHTTSSAINVHDAATVIKVHEAATIANIHDTAPVTAPVAAPIVAPAVVSVVAPVAAPVVALVVVPVASPVVAPAIAPVVAPATAPAEPSTSAAASVTASDNYDATAPPAKRPRVSVFRDSVGREVTSARLADVTDRFPYMTLSTLCTLYLKVTGHQLVPEGSDPQNVLRELGELEGYRLQSIRVTSTALNEAAYFDVIGHDGQEFAAMRRNIQTRLGLTEGPIRPIPAPLLCYHLVMLACTPVNQMTGIKLDWMFQKMTGQGLRSL
ncbi:hypothetical protein H4S07_003364, partial [Coemansia furcata]